VPLSFGISAQTLTILETVLTQTLKIQIAAQFSAAGVEAAVRQAQRGEIMYPEFTRQALAAGCVGYFVQITGKCVQYFGRNGEIHTEWFPGAQKK